MAHCSIINTIPVLLEGHLLIYINGWQSRVYLLFTYLSISTSRTSISSGSLGAFVKRKIFGTINPLQALGLCNLQINTLSKEWKVIRRGIFCYICRQSLNISVAINQPNALDKGNKKIQDLWLLQDSNKPILSLIQPT